MPYFLDGYRSAAPRALPEEVDDRVVVTDPAELLLAAQLSTFPEIVIRVVEKAEGPLEVGRAVPYDRDVRYPLPGRAVDQRGLLD